jgi:hypothetical protein
MNRWLKRVVYIFLLLFWLMVMAFPTFAFVLATKGELQLGDEPRSHVRFFMVQEIDTNGIGVEWVRAARQVDHCTRTTIRYLLWDGGSGGENANFCQCYDPVTNMPLPIEESRCTR